MSDLLEEYFYSYFYLYSKTPPWGKYTGMILLRDDFTCFYCNDRNINATVDHIIPISKNGSDSPSNLVCACKKCNSEKGTKSLEEFIS